MENFYFDIETCGSFKDLESLKQNDELGYNLFVNKYNRYKWEEIHSLDFAYLEYSPVISTFGKICCVSYGWLDGGYKTIKSIYGEDERDIVTKFNQVLGKVSLKNFNLVGFRVRHFDIPWLLHKLHSYGIKPAEIISIYDKKPWEMRIVDISELWKQKFAYSSTFDEVCYELSVKSPKTDMNGSEVHSTFWNGDYDKIKTYCESDVSALFDVSRKMGI